MVMVPKKWYDKGKFYPAGKAGGHSMTGEGAGAGYNVNVPWESAGVGDADYFAVWDHVLIPITRAFDPDIILISGGFDAAVGDPLGKCNVTPFGFSVMMKKLMDFANGKIVMALEGGYNLDSLSNSVLACVKTLLHDKITPQSHDTNASESSWCVIKAVRQELSKYWPVLADELPKNVVINSKKKIVSARRIRRTPAPVISAESCTPKKDSSFSPQVLHDSGEIDSRKLSCPLQPQSEVQFTTDIATVNPAIGISNNGTNSTLQAAALQRETNKSKFSQNFGKIRVILSSTEIKTPEDASEKQRPETSSICGTTCKKTRVISDLGKEKSPNHLFPWTDTSTITLADEVSNNETTSTSKAATLQGRTDNLKSSESLQKKRELSTDTEMKNPADVPVKKRWKPNSEGATDNETSKPKGVHEGDVTPLGFGKMLSTMESLLKRKPSMPRKFTTEESEAIEETKWVDSPECSVEEKIAYVEAMSPAFPQLCYYSATLQSKYASDVVQHHKQLAAKEQSKREETEALCNVAERQIEELMERLVAAEKEVSASNTKVKQQEAKSLDLRQRNDNLEAAKSAAQTEALEAKQRVIELGKKAAKLEAAKSAAEVEVAKAKQQASKLKEAKSAVEIEAAKAKQMASKLEAAKSAAEVEAAKEKQQTSKLDAAKSAAEVEAAKAKQQASKLEAAKSTAEVEAAKAKQQASKLEAAKSTAEVEDAKAKQQETKLETKVVKLEAAKSTAEAEATEAKQQVIELGSKASKLEEAKSAAEAEAAKAKQQAIELELRATKLEAAKSAAEAEAAEAKQQVVESQRRAATTEKKVIDAQQLVAKEREEREALKKTFDKSFQQLQEFSTLLGR